MKKAWEWIKNWGAVLFGVLLFFVGAGWVWRRRSRELGRVKDELTVERGKREIAHLRGKREEIARQVGEDDEAVREIDLQIAARKREVIEAHELGQGMSEREIEDAFARLGY